MRCLAAVSLIATLGTGAGTVLQAQGEEIAGNPGGGYFQDGRTDFPGTESN